MEKLRKYLHSLLIKKCFLKTKKGRAIMRNNDPATKDDLQSLKDFIRQENRRLDNSINEKIDSVNERIDSVDEKIDSVKKDVTNLESKVDNLENKVDNLTDAVIEGFDNTEQILSDWEGKPVNLISKEKKEKLKETA